MLLLLLEMAALVELAARVVTCMCSRLISGVSFHFRYLRMIDGRSGPLAAERE